MGKNKYSFNNLGRWWGSNPAEKKEEEIDILAVGNSGNVLFGECKWRAIRTGTDILDELIRKSELFPFVSKKQYILFSKSDYKSDLLKITAQRKDITLVGLKDMF